MVVEGTQVTIGEDVFTLGTDIPLTYQEFTNGTGTIQVQYETDETFAITFNNDVNGFTTLWQGSADATWNQFALDLNNN